MEKKWIKPRTDGKADKFFCVATFLPVKRWWSIPAFLKMSLRVEAQLKSTSGIVRYGLKTDLPRKRFWTLSVWNSRQVVNTFVAATPHQIAVKRFERWAGSGAAFVDWESPDSDPSWAEAMERLKNPAFRYDSRTS